MNNKSNKASVIFWFISTLIAGFISFVLFLMGISGSGDYDLINAAYWVWAIPSIIWGGISFLSVIFKSSATEHIDIARTQKDELDSTKPAIGRTGRKIIIFISLIIIISIPAYYLVMHGYDQYQKHQMQDSALFMEIRKGLSADPNFIKQLLKGGQDPNLRSRFGATPLMAALEFWTFENNEIIDLLLDYGADPNQKSVLYSKAILKDEKIKLKEYLPINIVLSKTGYRAELLKRMIQKGLDVNPVIESNSENKPSTVEASEEAEQEYGVGTDVTFPASPLISAIRSSGPGGYKTTELLLSVGADVTLPENQMALQYASESHNENIVNMLLNEPVSLEAITESIDIVERFMTERYCSMYAPVVLRNLKDEANRRLGENRFINHYSFNGQPVLVNGLVNYSERELTEPVAVLAQASNRVNYRKGRYYKSPSHKADLVGELTQEALVSVLTITDNRWYKVKLKNGDTGYMYHESLSPNKICLEGIR